MVDVMDLRPWESPEGYRIRASHKRSKSSKVSCDRKGPALNRFLSDPYIASQKNTTQPDSKESVGFEILVQIRHQQDLLKSQRGGCANACPRGDAMSGRRVLPLRQGVTLATRRSQLDSESSTPSELDVASELDASFELDLPFKPDIRLEPVRQAFPQDHPARLVHICEASSEEVTIHLIDAQEKSYQYAALSYCWGAQNPDEGLKWQLTEKNYGPHHENISMNTLPQTIRDSITITWKLGVTYIWIDALCIVQDSASDWAHEAAKMASIYRGSFVTIAASAGASAEQGCFNSASQRSTELCKSKDLITIKTSFPTGQESCLSFLDMRAHVPDLYDKEILNAPLSKRAWTYQEHVLPRRVLYYTPKQLLWECVHCRLSEDNFPQSQSARPYLILDFDYVLGQDDIAAFWYIGAVEQYSQRQMTFEKDKLIAISALAKATYYNKQSGYIVGLWKDSLTLGLMWCRSSDGHKSKTFPCPSWSWASQQSEISYRIAVEALEYATDCQLRYRDDNENQEEECLAWPTSQIISVDWQADQNNAFGNVSDAHIDLCTLLGTGTVVPRDFNKRSGYGKECTQAILIPYTSKSGKAEWFHAVATLDNSGVPGAHVAIALLREQTSLRPVFILLDPPDPNAGTFRRVAWQSKFPIGGGFMNQMIGFRLRRLGHKRRYAWFSGMPGMIPCYEAYLYL